MGILRTGSDEVSKGEMVIRTSSPENGQSKGINWVDQYRIDTQLPQFVGT